MTCPYSGCAKTFKIISSFTSHLSRCHKQCDVTHIAPSHIRETEYAPDDSDNGSNIDSEVQTVQQDGDSDPGSAQDRYIGNMALFFLGLQAKYPVPASTVSRTASELRVLQDIQPEFTMDLFSRGLQEYGVPNEALQNLGKYVYEHSSMQGPLHTSSGTLTTHHKRLQCYRKMFNLGEPVQITLDHDDTGKTRHFHYVPILEALNLP